jgi:hypothetical protein
MNFIDCSNSLLQRLRYEDPYPLGTLKAEWAVFIMAGRNKNRENMAKFPKTRHFIPVIIIPSKVTNDYGHKSQNVVRLGGV